MFFFDENCVFDPVVFVDYDTIDTALSDFIGIKNITFRAVTYIETSKVEIDL